MRGRNTSFDKRVVVYSHYWLVVKVIVLTAILDKLMLQIAISIG